jgi:hypothetical protein
VRSVLIVLPLLAAVPAKAEIVSVYTAFSEAACRSLPRPEPGTVLRRCPGAAGLFLHTQAEEATEAVFVGDPRRMRRWRDVELGPDDRPGERVEWRVRREAGRDTALAFILRVTFTGAAGRQVQGGVLAVAKIENGRSCLMALVPASTPEANVRAREAADTLTATFRCGAPVQEFGAR